MANKRFPLYLRVKFHHNNCYTGTSSSNNNHNHNYAHASINNTNLEIFLGANPKPNWNNFLYYFNYFECEHKINVDLRLNLQNLYISIFAKDSCKFTLTYHFANKVTYSSSNANNNNNNNSNSNKN